jgi:hypothetical protein
MAQQKWWHRWFSRTAQLEVTVETRRTLVITHSEIARTSEANQTTQPIDPAPLPSTLDEAIARVLTDDQPSGFKEVTDRDGN